MTITPQTIVALTADTLADAGLPGSPVVAPWRLWPWQKGDPACVAVLCASGSDAPRGHKFGPVQFGRTPTLTIVAWLAPAASDAALGASAVALQEAILDALFASREWCAQWMRGVPSVDWQISPHDDASVRACSVVITIRCEYDLVREYGTASETLDVVHYRDDEDAGGVTEGETETDQIREED